MEEKDSQPADVQDPKVVKGDDFIKSLNAATEGVLDKAKTRITEVETGLASQLSEIQKDLDEKDKKIEAQSKRIGDLTQELNDKEFVKSTAPHVARYGDIEEVNLTTFFNDAKDDWSRQTRRSQFDTPTLTRIGAIGTEYFKKGITGGFSSSSDDGNISEELRISKIADEGPNYQYRIANRIPSKMTGNVNEIRYPALAYPASGGTAAADPTRADAGRLKVDSGIAFIVQARNIGAQVATETDMKFKNITEDFSIIGSYIHVNREYLRDTSNLESFIRRKLVETHYDFLDDYILNSDKSEVNFAGLNQQAFQFTGSAANIRAAWKKEAGSLAQAFDLDSSATNYYDAVTCAKAVLRNRRYMPDTLILAVDDIEGFNLLRAKVTGEYLREPASRKTPFEFWSGLSVIPSNSQASGTFTLLDSRCVELWVREPIMLDSKIAGREGFLRNQVTLKTEQRLGLVCYERSGIISSQFSYFIKEIINAKGSEVATGLWGNPDGVIKTQAVT